MPSPTRRTVLASLAGVTVLGGCSSGGSSSPTRSSTSSGTERPSPTTHLQSEPTETSTPTDSPTKTQTESPTETPSPISAADLEFDVGVVRQPSGDDLGQIRAALTNHVDGTLELGGSDPLPVGFDTFATEKVDADTQLTLFPDQSDVTNDYRWYESQEPIRIHDVVYEGCWRMPDEVTQTMGGEIEAVEERERVEANFYPLATVDSGCPRGTYSANGEMHVQSMVGWNQFIRTTMTIDVGEDGMLRVDGTMSVSDP